MKCKNCGRLEDKNTPYHCNCKQFIPSDPLGQSFLSKEKEKGCGNKYYVRDDLKAEASFWQICKPNFLCPSYSSNSPLKEKVIASKDKDPDEIAVSKPAGDFSTSGLDIPLSEKMWYEGSKDFDRARLKATDVKEFIKRIEMTMLVTPSPMEKGEFILWLSKEIRELAGNDLIREVNERGTN